MNYNLLLNNVQKIDSLLDIGCFAGNFSFFMEQNHNINKNKILCIDINESYKETIESRGYRFIGTGLNSEKKIVPVYYPNNACGLWDSRNTGVSYYKENTIHFEDCLVKYQNVVPLDEIVIEETFDFVKIDVQGAEYDVILGGKNTLEKSKYILVETSCGDYNIGAKNEKETIEILKSIGFQQKVILDEHIIDGILQQKDILFEKV